MRDSNNASPCRSRNLLDQAGPDFVQSFPGLDIHNHRTPCRSIAPKMTDKCSTASSCEESMLRKLFPDKDVVLIYPDDFPQHRDLRDDQAKKIHLADLLDRHVGHFSDRRVAILFRPGVYDNIDCPVGYWTQVIGLGETPDDVKFTGKLGVYAFPANTENPNVGSLDTFWRSAENFTSQTEFLQNKEGKWSVPIPAGNGQTKLYPVADLSHSEHGYPPDQVLPELYTPQFGMLWAVSQAAPLRRIRVKAPDNLHSTLHLSLGDNCASGGFMSNVAVDGYLALGSQQQYCLRNCHVKEKATGGAWSFVLVGCQSGDENSGTAREVGWATRANVRHPCVAYESTTACCIEKPFLFLGKDDDQLYLGLPKLRRNTAGIHHQSVHDLERIPINTQEDCPVLVITPDHVIDDVQQAGDQGRHLILNPGTYSWGKTLYIWNSNQVVLGIGMATIQAPTDGSPCIQVASSAQGVRISGLSLEASSISKYEDSALLQWGEPATSNLISNAENPSAMHDLYCFVGGRSMERTVAVETMVKVFSSHVVGDNLWLWRADHVQLQENEQPNMPELSEYHVTKLGECRCDVGLNVFGDHVTMYGLAVEHTYGDMLKWHGKHGSVYFYQSELPYDVHAGVYPSSTSGYRIHEAADNHVAKGIGIYSYFRDHENVLVDSPILHEAKVGGMLENVFTVWLNGHSGFQSIVNGKGEPTTEQGKPYVIFGYPQNP